MHARGGGGLGGPDPFFLMNNDVMHTAIYAAFCYRSWICKLARQSLCNTMNEKRLFNLIIGANKLDHTMN